LPKIKHDSIRKNSDILGTVEIETSKQGLGNKSKPGRIAGDDHHDEAFKKRIKARRSQVKRKKPGLQACGTRTSKNVARAESEKCGRKTIGGC